MKMKQVCEETGLTEKAVRLYIRQELVQPTVTEGLHNTSYDFSPDDIRQLKIVAALRAADFSMADIREIQLHPEQLPHFLEEHKKALDAEIQRKQALAEAIDRLSASETGSLEAAANAMRPAQRQELERDKTPYGAAIALIAVIAVIVLDLRYSFRDTPEIAWLPLWLILALCGCLAMFMGMRYATCTRRARKLPHKTHGTVVSVTKQTGYDASYSIQTTATSGPRWGGNGGLWTIFFMVWGELRPDHWVPVIQFNDQNGKLRSGEYIYGGLKHSFHAGDRLEIAWDKYPTRVLPLDAPWLARKGLAYILLGALMFALGGAMFLKLMSAVIGL